MTANTNDFVPWATGDGANVLASAAYQAVVIRQQGAQYGIADPVTFNTAMRQASEIATIIAQFTADYGPSNVQDNGNIAALEAQFIAALTRLIGIVVGPSASTSLYYGGPDTGTANNYIFASPSPSITSYVEGMAVLVTVAHANAGGSVVNLSGLGNKTMVRIDGSALQAGDLLAAGVNLLVYNHSGTFSVLNILQTVSSVPVATTTSNGIARQATTTEAANATTSGSVPAFVTPEGLSSYTNVKWTTVNRTASFTETAYNEYILIQGAANFTITLVSPVGNIGGAYDIVNFTDYPQNIVTPANTFQGNSDIPSGLNYVVMPARSQAFLFSDGVNWIFTPELLATITNRGIVRLANGSEAFNGVTSGTKAAMTPEDVAIYVAGQVASTVARGIARQATIAECNAGATSGSSPAFVSPEGLTNFASTQQLYNPFTTTGIGAVILAYSGSSSAAFVALNGTGAWSASGGTSGLFTSTVVTSTITVGSANLYASDYRWAAVAPAGTWRLIQVAWLSGTTSYCLLIRIA
jgi:hypothetical protein